MAYKKNINICSRCIYDDQVPNIYFDKENVCNYCHQIDYFSKEFKTGTFSGKQTFLNIVDNIKEQGKRKKYDVIVGVSGGTDSSFLLHLAVELGLRPLAVHYDNTWNTATSTQNIKKFVAFTLPQFFDLHCSFTIPMPISLPFSLSLSHFFPP